VTESAAALIFLWLGMVLAISFLEAPLKFRAPGVTLRVGLGIGRLVFRVLNIVEAVLALAVVVLLQLGEPTTAATVAAAVAVLTLAAQVVVVRPMLTHRTDAVLAGHDAPRSHAHLAYIALEVVKVVTLVVSGVLLLRG
jgi:hypothetical protein